MTERRTPRRQPSQTSTDISVLGDRIMGRIDDLREDLSGRMDTIDERLTGRMDRVEGRVMENRDAANSRELAVTQQLNQAREAFELGLSTIRADVDELKEKSSAERVQEAAQSIVAKAADGAAAGGARGVVEAGITPDILKSATQEFLNSPWGMVVKIAGGVITLSAAVTLLPKIYQGMADFLSSVAFFLGGGV